LRVYDVTDLLYVPLDVPAPALGVSVSVDPKNPRPASASPVTSEHITPDAFLRRTFEPGLAAQVADNSEWRSGRLLALNTTPVLHDQVERTIATARDRAQVQVRFHLKLVLMEPHVRLSRFPLVRLDWQVLPDQPGLLFADLDPKDLDYVTTNLRLNSRPSKDLDTRHYPLISAYAGQLAHAATLDQVVHQPMSLLQGGTTAALTIGDTIAVRGTPTADRRYLMLEIDHRRCAAIDKQTMDFGVQGTATIPLLWQGGERIRRSIPIGYGLIIATGAYLDTKEARSGFLIIRPELRTAAAGGEPQVTIQAP
jgi:hypothetical protein